MFDRFLSYVSLVRRGRDQEKKVEDLELKDLKEEGKERDEWREDLTAARKELEQLRDEKKQLRDLLLKRQAPQGVC